MVILFSLICFASIGNCPCKKGQRVKQQRCFGITYKIWNRDHQGVVCSTCLQRIWFKPALLVPHVESRIALEVFLLEVRRKRRESRSVIITNLNFSFFFPTINMTRQYSLPIPTPKIYCNCSFVEYFFWHKRGKFLFYYMKRNRRQEKGMASSFPDNKLHNFAGTFNIKFINP